MAAYDATEAAAGTAGDLANTFNEARKRRLARCRAHCGVAEAAQASVRRHHSPFSSAGAHLHFPSRSCAALNQAPPQLLQQPAAAPAAPKLKPVRSKSARAVWNPDVRPQLDAPTAAAAASAAASRAPPLSVSAELLRMQLCKKLRNVLHKVCTITARRPTPTTSVANRPPLHGVGGWKPRRAAFTARARLT